jgi:DNA-binding NarL/FixJ family response regulator
VQDFLAILWQSVIADVPGIQVVGVVGEAEKLYRIARQARVHLVLVDGKLPGKSMDPLIAYLHELDPRPKVIVMGNELEFGRKFLHFGADSYVSKGDQPEWLFETMCRYGA